MMPIDRYNMATQSASGLNGYLGTLFVFTLFYKDFSINHHIIRLASNYNDTITRGWNS